MECQSMLFIKNHIPYRWDLSNSFSNSFINFYSCEGFHQVIYPKEWSIKLCIDNGGWHETLNLLHVSRCEMLHFVTWNKTKVVNKLSRVRSTDWKSALKWGIKHYFTVFPVKPWTPEKICGMFIASWPIRCEMKPQKITEKPQQGSVTTWNETTSWPYLLQEIFNFSIVSLWKSYFFNTNQH